MYRLTYTTLDNSGKSITASGALLVPVSTQAMPLLSYQHGTIRPDDEGRAPSYYTTSSEVYSAVSVLASTGYIVSAPDYIGYGASKNLPHPYEHAASLASASLDMLRAAREFAAKEKVALNSKNFLLGYSEGGYATLALHKLIEEKAATEFTVTASAPGAGAYHKTAFADYILKSNEPLNFLSTYVWVLDTYNRTYGLNRPINYYVNEPWATQLQTNLYGEVPSRARSCLRPSSARAFWKKLTSRC
ncbi:alpha/beta hydrolase family protein [Hymenobacter cellulosilyticus]|uniref:Lipase family protein n=1 Tax=Hymenobacter cellulosilyticus TaxID=2932248 RepID=A0A8T9Q9D9_9BACT|nr:lipase family protein [Hymenobacter cellulosilyticus]UOQ73602.1 lipase family protein [Hymenobacter cellulosilyticus]